MIKSIFVPISGSGADDILFAAALAVAQPLGAHLDFYHLRFTPIEAAVRTRHVEFCVGSEINIALDDLRKRDEDSSVNASRHFSDFCSRNEIAVRSAPHAAAGISAALTQETDNAEERLVSRARHSDLVVMGRPKHDELLPDSLIELLLLGSGRPVLIASEVLRTSVTDTIVVGWKETSEAARAVASAMPLLKVARKVVLIHIVDDGVSSPDALNQLSANLAWHGITAETRLLVAKSSPATELLRAAADVRADLLVVGGYGHKPLSEAVFGGVTRSLIEHADVPVFLMH